MGKPPEEIPDEFAQHCDDLREAARTEFARRSKEDGQDLSELEQVAWFAGMDQSTDELVARIEQARESGASWKAIAIALGESGDPKSANRIRNRYFKRL